MLKKLEETFELSWKSKNIVKLFKLMTMVLFISHIFACVWLFESRLFPINEDEGFSNWMIFSDVYQLDLKSKYIMAMYFVVVTMATVGYGDVAPKV